ncbi:hypothetical protein SAMN05192574_101391 [Mucilaginibacter gossypiicola]|uniref:Uncharacterized protein n=1 Tax=Mucilaginibacter gossypiicola TaxID=551995 RepID=A0A1H8A9M5_9SPHI|nr:hypothetical protein [Mucilaginibacter gossypiicola]SEM66499.1 hypothetical protein SAMN05192574_101391 [Mucilaginibacter gossypiicola]
MITEAQYIAYFTGLAQKHNQIRHGVDGRTAFFFIPVDMDLKEIDNAIRATKATPMMALDSMNGTFSDNNGTQSHLQTISGQFTILDKADPREQEDIRGVQDKCLAIGLQVCARMHNELKGNPANPNLAGGARFVIHNVQYDPVGPMAGNHYGYTFRYTITCPFGFTVDSGNWLDK